MGNYMHASKLLKHLQSSLLAGWDWAGEWPDSDLVEGSGLPQRPPAWQAQLEPWGLLGWRADSENTLCPDPPCLTGWARLKPQPDSAHCPACGLMGAAGGEHKVVRNRVDFSPYLLNRLPPTQHALHVLLQLGMVHLEHGQCVLGSCCLGGGRVDLARRRQHGPVRFCPLH